MQPTRALALIAALACASPGCGDDGDHDSTAACAVTPPAGWSAPQWSANTVEALALRARLDALAAGGLMRAAEQGTAVIGSTADLEDLYSAGEPSLADVTTPAFDAIVGDAFVDFVLAANAGPGDPIDDAGAWTPGAGGGIYGDSQRAINPGGLELRQIVDKGMFSGGTLYNYALRRTEGTITPSTVDALAAIWGANENLDPAGAITDAANYSRQMGFHATIASDLIAAKAYAADNDCSDERDAALRSFFRHWEESMYARFVYYANQGATRTAAGTDDNDLIEALHQIAEGIGLALGFLDIPSPTSGPLAGAAVVIEPDEVDAIMNAIGVDTDELAASTLGLFVEDAAGFATAVRLAEEHVAEIYGFTDTQIASFRTPTAG